MADKFESIDLIELEDVTGGRYAKLGKTEIRPELIQAIGELAKAVQSISQTRAQTDQQKFAQMFQFMQKMMEERGGGKKG